MKDYIAFFDMDNTILNTYSGKLFFKYSFKVGKISKLDLIKLIPYPILYKLKILEVEKITQKIMYDFKGMSKEEMYEYARDTYNNYMKDHIRKEILEEINFHKNNNAHLVIISASPRSICTPIMENLGFDDLICTELEFDENDIFTGKIGEYCYDVNKVTFAERYLENHHFDLSTAYFYSDSYTDIPLLDKVKYPICVHPDKRLKKYALDKNWKIIK